MTKYSPKYIGNEKVRKNANTIIIKMIIRAFETVNDSSYDENQIRSKYLLGQIIRQYNIPVSNVIPFCVSLYKLLGKHTTQDPPNLQDTQNMPGVQLLIPFLLLHKHSFHYLLLQGKF